MSNLLLFSVSDRYINYLRNDSKLHNVYDNKDDRRTHTRKYLGAVFQKNGYDYFIPLSSPKDTDYLIDAFGNKKLRKSVIPIIRMVEIDNKTGKIELKGTLRISNMIPVPQSELSYYDINSETDLDYKNLVNKEYAFIKSNQDKILKNAEVCYNQKINKENLYENGIYPKYLDNVVDFAYAEKCCQLFIDDNPTN